MKLMSLAGGLPHYYNLVLNKLQREMGVEVCVVVPASKGATLGAGVFESKDGIEFKVFYQEEYTTFYGKKFFRGLKELILQEKPDVLMVNWPYQASFVFYPGWYTFLRRNQVALVSKEIPFQVPHYNEAISYYLQGGGVTENNQAHQQNKSMLARIKFMIVRETRRLFSNLVDAHINYLDEAVAMHASYGVPAEKVFVTANSPDTDALFEHVRALKGVQANPFQLLHIGRLVKWKQVDLLIEATIALRQKYPLTELSIVGDGPELEALKTQAAGHEFIQFHGGVYDPMVLGKITCEAGIYVLAGMGGLSINEAMCFAKPVVCSVADGTEKRLVREGYNGHFFESGSLASLTSVIEKLFADPAQINVMGKRSQEIIEKEINIHTVLGNYMEAFRFAIASQSQTVASR
jgi:glycosyltransferase involved in cell wall biosynthesis